MSPHGPRASGDGGRGRDGPSGPPGLEGLLEVLARHVPATDRRLPWPRAAAVAVVLRSGREGPELLFVRRPDRRGDRWSGDVAFPGGLAQPGDADLVATARREAREEVGLALADPVAALSGVVTAAPGGLRPLRVRPWVFAVPAGSEPRPDPHEVAEAFWFPVPRLLALPVQRTTKRLLGLRLRFPALDLDGRHLWGLTLMMVEELRGVLRAGA